MKQIASLGSTPVAVLRAWQGMAAAAPAIHMAGFALGSQQGYEWRVGWLWRAGHPQDPATITDLRGIIAALRGGYFNIWQTERAADGRHRHILIHAATNLPAILPIAGIKATSPRYWSEIAAWQSPADVPQPRIETSRRSRCGQTSWVKAEARVRRAVFALPDYLIGATDFSGHAPLKTAPTFPCRRDFRYTGIGREGVQSLAWCLTWQQALAWARAAAFADAEELRRLNALAAEDFAS